MALLLASLAGCATEPVSETGSVTPPPVPRGFECPMVPSGFEPAGSIFRIDKSGTFYRVAFYGEEPAILAMKGYRRGIPIANYALASGENPSAGALFGVLQNALPGLTAAANADFKKKLGGDVVVSDMRAEFVDEQVADHILERFRQDVRPKAGSKYYLVRETIRAGKISYRLKRDDLAKLSDLAELEYLASGKADITFKDNNGFLSITRAFPNRVPVCMKTAEIIIGPKKGKLVSVTLKDWH